jgi:hypothetical protein
MISPKRTKPASAETAGELRGIQQLGSRLNPSPNTPSPARLQAPDDAGESDWAFFRARPGATIRTRLPFPDEFPDDFIACGGGVAFVRVAVVRDDRGLPVWAARSVMFCIQGGNA